MAIATTAQLPNLSSLSLIDLPPDEPPSRRAFPLYSSNAEAEFEQLEKTPLHIEHDEKHLEELRYPGAPPALKNKIPNLNANNVELFGRKFILTQCPTDGTLQKFWETLWNEQVETIICLTSFFDDPQGKSYPYWNTKKVGNLTIQCNQIEIKDLVDGKEMLIYKLATILLTKDDETREIKHYYYEMWIDKAIPHPQHFDPFLKTLIAMDFTKKPTVVHCSAGYGRSGTLVAILGLIQRIQDLYTHHLTIFPTVSEVVTHLRQQRGQLTVQKPVQYKMIYTTVGEWSYTNQVTTG